MTTHSPSPAAPTHGRATLMERYVHAVTRRLPEEQRDDVADELRASIADRVDSLQGTSDLTGKQAEYAALEELGDPDRLAAGYTGKRLQLIGPELYPAYSRVLKGVLVAVVPIVMVVIAVVGAFESDPVGSIIGKSIWVGVEVALQIAFWITLTFAIVERTSTPDSMEESLGVEWTPDNLPDLPNTARGSLGDTVAAVVWPAFVAAAILWQQVRSPLEDSGDDGGRLPLLDPDLWSFWLPLILVLLAVEIAFEVVKYLTGRWTVALAAANTVLAVVFAAPIAYLAASERLLNPAAIAEIQEGWPGFDPGVTHTVILVSAVLICVWDTFDGWRKSLTTNNLRRL